MRIVSDSTDPKYMDFSEWEWGEGVDKALADKVAEVIWETILTELLEQEDDRADLFPTMSDEPTVGPHLTIQFGQSNAIIVPLDKIDTWIIEEMLGDEDDPIYVDRLHECTTQAIACFRGLADKLEAKLNEAKARMP